MITFRLKKKRNTSKTHVGGVNVVGGVIITINICTPESEYLYT